MFETNERLERLKRKIAAKKTVTGCFVLLSDPSVSEMVGMAGCDFVWIDSEHGMFDRTTIKNHIVYAQCAGACAFVRVPGVDPDQVKCILDCGPDGIIFPNVTSREMAEKAVKACTYPTEGGVRGVGPGRVIKYGIESEAEYLEKGKDFIWKIFQIESLEGVENLQQIAEVDGFHSLFVGPADLSMSMRACHVPESEISEKISEIQALCGEIAAKNGKFSGSCAEPDKFSCQQLINRGIQWMTIGQDMRLISTALAEAVRKINKD